MSDNEQNTDDQDRGEIILYEPPDGAPEIQLHARDGHVWMTQAEMAELFQTSAQNITLHIKSVYREGELDEESTCKDYLQVRHEGGREISRTLKHYNLEMVLAVGYRVRSPRGTQFRQWATRNLRDYLVKGFVMNDERLKDPGGWDYFDELLQRIRDIRASEKRFYQKVRDLFALSEDYNHDQQAVNMFFAEVQNKMLHAVTGHTAAELIVERADPDQPNMNLQSWKGDRVRKHDVIVAKNYLDEDEITELNRIVTMFLDYAEDRVQKRKKLTLEDWRNNVDRFITFNERPLLEGKGKISQDRAQKIAHERYEQFDANRKQVEANAADEEDFQELESIENELGKAQKLSGTSSKTREGDG